MFPAAAPPLPKLFLSSDSETETSERPNPNNGGGGSLWDHAELAGGGVYCSPLLLFSTGVRLKVVPAASAGTRFSVMVGSACPDNNNNNMMMTENVRKRYFKNILKMLFPSNTIQVVLKLF